MPVIEHLYRVKQAIKKKMDKFFVKQAKWERYSPYIENIKKAYISGFEKYFPTAKRQLINSAENIINHRFKIFRIVKDFGNLINWHIDPKTNNSWPRKFWGDINYRDGKTIGGIKFGWELNRLHHFPRVAIAFSLRRNYRYKDEIFNQLASWLESNPYPKGINWISGIELGIRIINIIYTLKFLGDEPLSPEQQRLIIQFISIHGNHLFRYPSKYSSQANHAIGEALGMFAAGICFPSIDGAKKWKSFGKKVLEREVTRQIYPDGSGFEHSIHYLQFILDHFLIYYLLCREYGEPYNKAVEEKLKSSFEFISNILDKSGNYPSIGDEDNGYLLKLWFGRHNNFVSLLNTGAVLFDNSKWILKNSEFDHKTFFLLGKDSKIKWDELKRNKNSVDTKNQYFRNAGLAIIGDKNKSEILFIGNSGSLGLKPLGGHGHADALSFWLSYDSQPVFIDPGTYLYHSGGKWRTYFRSTSAHNTIRVDRHDQATIVGDFIFKNFYKIKRPYFNETEEKIVWSAGHDGYMILKDPVFHKREVTYIKKEKQMVIVDYIDCRKSHLIECFFHLYPECFFLKDGHFFDVIWGKAKIRMKVDEKWNQQKIIKGKKKPLNGWYSPRFNQIQESQTLVLSANIEGSESFCSTIYIK